MIKLHGTTTVINLKAIITKRPDLQIFHGTTAILGSYNNQIYT
jgi:hypothetical protein